MLAPINQSGSPAISRYRRAIDECMARAEKCSVEEIRQLWITIAASWHFLLQREERLTEETDRAARA